MDERSKENNMEKRSINFELRAKPESRTIFGTATVFIKVMHFHWQYYFTTGVDWYADQLINIDLDPDEFSVFMRDQLEHNRLSDAYRYLKNWQLVAQCNMDF